MEPQSDLHGPLEVSENEIPVLESCELSRNEPVQSLDLHIVECRIEIETLAKNFELMDFWKDGLICITKTAFTVNNLPYLIPKQIIMIKNIPK